MWIKKKISKLFLGGRKIPNFQAYAWYVIGGWIQSKTRRCQQIQMRAVDQPVLYGFVLSAQANKAHWSHA